MSAPNSKEQRKETSDTHHPPPNALSDTTGSQSAHTTSNLEKKHAQDGVNIAPVSSRLSHTTPNPNSNSTIYAFASQADELEHTLPLSQALRDYRWAIIWSLILSSTLIMEGFDTSLLGSLYALPPFKRKYGVCRGAVTGTSKGIEMRLRAESDCELTAPWQSGLSNGASVGSILGLWFAG